MMGRKVTHQRSWELPLRAKGSRGSRLSALSRFVSFYCHEYFITDRLLRVISLFRSMALYLVIGLRPLIASLTRHKNDEEVFAFSPENSTFAALSLFILLVIALCLQMITL